MSSTLDSPSFSTDIMSLQINSPGWIVTPAAPPGAAATAADALPRLPAEFLQVASRVVEERLLTRDTDTDAAGLPASDALDLTCDTPPGLTALLAIRLPSGALTFHVPVQVRPRHSRFRVTVRRRADSRDQSQTIKLMIVGIARTPLDAATGLALPSLAEAFERRAWKRHGLKEGWHHVTAATLAKGRLSPRRPASPKRSLLLLHGPLSSTSASFRGLARTKFFERIRRSYGDRVYGFEHFTMSRTPEENVRMLLEGLPEAPTLFDVIAYSRGGLVLRTLVERSAVFGPLGARFRLGQAVLAAVPNEGTPLGDPRRWMESACWLANAIEALPDNPFTFGAEFVAAALVWIANHASGELPGLHAMGPESEVIESLQAPPGAPAASYSALATNYQLEGPLYRRLLDAGLEQMFTAANDLIVPSDGSWRVDRSGQTFIPANRIGCFGPGGNLRREFVTHFTLLNQSEAADFLVASLLGRPAGLPPIDPTTALPDRRRLREISSISTPAPARPAAAAAEAPAPKAVDEALLRVTVAHGDLSFEPAPLLLGHYRSRRLTGTEAVADRALGRVMQRSLDIGLYPNVAGSHQIFLNRGEVNAAGFAAGPGAVIVGGLGDEGKLHAADLLTTVRQAVIAWVHRTSEVNPSANSVELASTLIGSGGTGVPVEESARLIVQAVVEANALLKDFRTSERSTPGVTHLRFIELYLDRASDAWHGLRAQQQVSPRQFVLDEFVQTATGGLQRLLSARYRGTDHALMSIVTMAGEAGAPRLHFTLDTKNARSEVRAHRVASALVRDLIAQPSNDRASDPRIGPTLHSLLIPVEIEPSISGTEETHLVLDAGTAAIPWELLQAPADQGQRLPWAIRVKLLRQIQVSWQRETPAAALSEPRVLLIGEPASPPNYPRMPGARQEVTAVYQRLTALHQLDRSQVTQLTRRDDDDVGPGAGEVVNALHEAPWRVVHLCGHGEIASATAVGGLVLSNGAFLGPREIAAMRQIPELVFVNTCHPTAADPLIVPNYDRVAFAAGLARALIEIGVESVVVAGWAVDDVAATTFATTFYGALLRGARFIDAVAEARAATHAFSPQTNTWAAFQCYGNADWVLRRAAFDAAALPSPPEPAAELSSAEELNLSLEQLTVEIRFHEADRARQLQRLRIIESQYGQRWFNRGDVAERFGDAFAAIGALDSAMQWYERALSTSGGRPSFRAAEQLANLRCRVAVEILARIETESPRPPPASDVVLTSPPPAPQVPAHVATASIPPKPLERARELIGEAIALLENLWRIAPTVERDSLLGAAYKRLALVEAAAKNGTAETSAIEKMHAHYLGAEKMAAAQRPADVFYPAANRMAAELVLNAARQKWSGFDGREVAAVMQALASRPPDFWSEVGQIEMRVYQAAAKRELAAAQPALERAYEDLFARAKNTAWWRSAYDQMRFVLPRYADAVRVPAERRAAAAILEKLGSLCGWKPAGDGSGVPAGDVFIACAPDDNDLAEQLAARLRGFGNRAVTLPDAIDAAEGFVVILSSATNRPSPKLSRQWSAILERKWADPQFPLFVVTRHRRAVRPAFLGGLRTTEIHAGARGLSTTTTIAKRIHRSLMKEQR
jgi:tetratricopeptide (TPR) repeat protein